MVLLLIFAIFRVLHGISSERTRPHLKVDSLFSAERAWCLVGKEQPGADTRQLSKPSRLDVLKQSAFVSWSPEVTPPHFWLCFFKVSGEAARTATSLHLTLPSLSCQTPFPSFNASQAEGWLFLECFGACLANPLLPTYFANLWHRPTSLGCHVHPRGVRSRTNLLWCKYLWRTKYTVGFVSQRFSSASWRVAASFPFALAVWSDPFHALHLQTERVSLEQVLVSWL